MARRQGMELRKLDRIAKAVGPVHREGLTEQLVRKLESLIVRGVIKSGEQLPPERQLADMLTVSRSSLRGALKALQVMGVLEVRQGAGTYLAVKAKEILSVPPRLLLPLDGMSEAELFEVRRAFEAESAATAAERATEADLKEIRARLEALRASTNDQQTYLKNDMGFHHAIAAASGNRFFIHFLRVADKFFLNAFLKRPPIWKMDVSIAEHEDIFRMIEAKDPEAARLKMLHHVSYQKYFMFDRGTPVDPKFFDQAP